MADINNLRDFANGQIVSAESLNTIKNASKEAYNKVNSFADIQTTNINNVGVARAYIDLQGRLVLENLKGNQGDKGIQGERGLEGKAPTPIFSVYDNGTIYHNNKDIINFVVYEGQTYVPLKDTIPAGIKPTNSENWLLIVQKGVDGTGGNISINNIPDINLEDNYSIKVISTPNGTHVSAILVKSSSATNYVEKEQHKPNKILVTNAGGTVTTSIMNKLATTKEEQAPSELAVDGLFFAKVVD